MSKVNVILEFREKELIQDVRSIAYSEGESIKAELASSGKNDDGQLTSLIQDIAEDINIDRLTRVLGLAHAEIEELLYPYTNKEIERCAWRDDTLKEKIVYRLDLKVPDTMSRTTINLLEHYVHEFLVARVLADWLTTHYPKSAERWVMTAENMKTSIQSCTISRMTRVRKRQSPF